MMNYKQKVMTKGQFYNEFFKKRHSLIESITGSKYSVIDIEFTRAHRSLEFCLSHQITVVKKYVPSLHSTILYFVDGGSFNFDKIMAEARYTGIASIYRDSTDTKEGIVIFIPGRATQEQVDEVVNDHQFLTKLYRHYEKGMKLRRLENEKEAMEA